MASYRYDEFRLTLSARGDGTYDALGVGPDGIEHRATFRVPLVEHELERAVVGVAQTTRSTRDVGGVEAPTMDAVDLGSALADALLVGDIELGYDTAKQRAAADDRGIRLVLSLGEAPALLSVPWELLYRRPTFLANQRRTPVVRHLDVAGLADPPAVDGTVRILGVIANPDDTAPLDVVAERARVEQAVSAVVAAGRVTLDWLEPATPRRLREALRDGTYHVLHYVGHGDFTPEGEGVLYLESTDGTGDHTELGQAELASLLGDQSSLRLVVINACDGARTTLTDPFAGVATTLVQLGVPAVVAMQFPISDAAAILFAEELYTNLIGRQAPIDAAVSEARKAIYIEQGSAEWATPVLFMADTEVELWSWDERPSAPVVSTEAAVEVPDEAASTPWSVVVEPEPPRAPGRRRRRSRTTAIVGLALLAAAGVVAYLLARPDSPDTGAVDDRSASAPRDVPTSTVAPPPPGADVASLAAPVTFTDSITTGGTTKDFPVDLTAGQNVYISSDTPCGADLTAELLGPSGDRESGYARPVCQDIGRIVVPTSGTHTFSVTANGAATGEFAVTITPVRADLQASLDVGAAAIGTIEAVGEHHRYNVALTAGDVLYLDARAACGAELYYELTSPSDVQVLGYPRRVCDDGGRAPITENGPHELLVYGDGRATGPYDVAVAPVRADGGGALAPGGVAAGSIDQAGAQDVWTFDARIGDTVVLTPQVECGAEVYYEVLSASDDSQLGYPFRACDAGSFVVTESGQHRIAVAGYGAATGEYGLAFGLTPG